MIRLTPKGYRRVCQGHPWIFRTDLQGQPEAEPGTLLPYAAPDGRVLGIGAWSATSSIALRALPLDPKLSSPAEIDAGYMDLLRAAIDRRAARPETCRLCNADADGLPGLIIDRYGSGISLQTLTYAADIRLNKIVQYLEDRFHPEIIALRNDVKTREMEGLPQEKKLLKGDHSELLSPIGDLMLYFDLMEGQKTGGFIDQTDNRLAAAAFAQGDCLDCFCYDGGFSMQMAHKGLNVTAVDSSAKAIERLKRNAEYNHLTVNTLEANVFDALRQFESEGRKFDTIVLDPPAFVKSRAAVESGRRAYKEINLRAFKLLRAGGRLVTCSCSAHMRRPDFELTVAEAAADAHRFARVIDRKSAAPDHPTLLTAPETDYLKVLMIEVS